MSGNLLQRYLCYRCNITKCDVLNYMKLPFMTTLAIAFSSESLLAIVTKPTLLASINAFHGDGDGPLFHFWKQFRVVTLTTALGDDIVVLGAIKGDRTPLRLIESDRLPFWNR